MKDVSTIILFMDDDPQPLGEFLTPVAFELDTRKLTDGTHVLKLVSKDNKGKEGLRLLPFVVRNGPAIAIEGLKKDEVVEGVLPLMINAYGKGDQKSFILHGSETPRSIPWWIVVLIVLFVAWSGYFIITSLSVRLY
jgi:hypothetical protein